MESVVAVIPGFLFNLFVAVIIVRFIYYPQKQNKNYVFTFLAFNITIHFIMSALAGVELSVGLGFGLFGLFSLLRYRTRAMPAREMTYLFIIAVPLTNSIMVRNGDVPAMLSLTLP